VGHAHEALRADCWCCISKYGALYDRYLHAEKPNNPRADHRRTEESGPRNGRRLVYGTGSTRRRDDLGEATYAMMIKPGRRSTATAVSGSASSPSVPFDEEDESPFVGLLQVECT
jgi:hypothetical protein